MKVILIKFSDVSFDPVPVSRGDSLWLSFDITDEEYEEWLRVKLEWEAWQIRWAQVKRGR